MHKYISLFLVTLLLVSSCANDAIVTNENANESQAKIFNTPEGAIPGEILVKFKSENTQLLDNVAAATRSGNQVIITRTGLARVDEQLNNIDAHQLERVFPIDSRREEITRKSGLNLWYVVRFDEKMDLATVANQLARTGDIDKVQFSHFIRKYRDSEGELNRFVKSVPYIRSKQDQNASKPFKAATYNDPQFDIQWDLHNEGEAVNGIKGMLAGADINALSAWDICSGDPSIIVAVLDEGVMHTHPDLKDNMWVNPNEKLLGGVDADGNGYVDDVHGYNFVRNKGIITWDKRWDTGHGTHVAGSVAAVNNNGIGISSIAGGSGNGDGIKIMSCQIFDGQNVASVYEEAQAIKYAADNGAVILQCSWGFNSAYASFPDDKGFDSVETWIQYSSLEKEALDYFIHNAGSPNGVIDGGIAIFAAGNESGAQAGFPGAHPDYISVASMAGDFSPSTFTNYHRFIDLTAPGGDSDFHLDTKGMILSTLPTHVAESGYGYMEGTSMACPHVSGIVALGLSYATKLHKHFKASAFKDMVIESCHAFDDSVFEHEKEYYYYFSEFGMNTKSKMNLPFYKGKMGAGYIDPVKLLNKVADNSNGVSMRIPNVRIDVNKTTSLDLSQYFVNGKDKTFTVTGGDDKIATTQISGTTLTVSGVATGSTSVLVKAEGVEQVVSIVVRNGGGNGWL